MSWKKYMCFKSNILFLNISKINCMVFAAKNGNILFEESKIIIEYRYIERVYKTKLLWVVVDNKLNWLSNADFIATNSNKNIVIFDKLKKTS